MIFRKRVIFALVFLISLNGYKAIAADSTLDPNFDGDGKIISISDTSIGYFQGSAIQADGKILIASTNYSNGTEDFVILRFNADGSLDNSFDSDGIKVLDIGTRADIAQAIKIQPDGKILVAGSSDLGEHTDFALVRFNQDGSLDVDFGAGGIVTTTFPASVAIAQSINLQSDGKIFLAGYVDWGIDKDFAVAKYLPDGSLDPSFVAGGITTTDLNVSSLDYAYSSAIQPDNSLIVTGYSETSANPKIAVAKYLLDGSLDASFGTGGIVIKDLGSGSDKAYAIVIQSDGKFVVAGQKELGSESDFALLRYNADGTLDSSFGASGEVNTSISSGYDIIYATELQSDGKIVVGGCSDCNSLSDFALARYNTNGSLDTTFGTNGFVVTDFGATDEVRALAIQSNGKIVASGTTGSIGNWRIALARYGYTASNSGGSSSVSTSTANPSILVLANPKKVKASFFKSLDASTISSISSSQFSKLPEKIIALITPTQASGLTFEQLKALKPSQVSVLKPSAIAIFNSTQISALQPADFRLMKPSQIAKISADAAAGLSKSDLNALNRTQLQSLTPNVIKNLKIEILKSLSVNKLRQFSLRQISTLTDEQKLAIIPNLLIGLGIK